MALSEALNVPGLAGWIASEQMNRQREGQDLQNAQGAMSLQDILSRRKQDELLKSALAQSGGDVDKALEMAIKAGDVKAAHALAPLFESQRKKEETQALAKLDMTDPAALRTAAQTRKDPRFLTAAEHIEKQREDAATRKAMQSAVIQPDPQEISQAADQGTPAPVPGKSGGLFADLMGSSLPHIAQEAKGMQAQVDRGTAPAAYWQRRRDDLANREAQYLQAKALADRKGDAAPPIIDPKNADKTGDDFLKTLPIADRGLVKKVANYDVDPKTLSTRGGQREKILALVAQYNPEYDDTQYANKRRAITQFGTGPQGNTVRSLNVAIEHIDTLQRAADALKNKEFTPGNKAYNELAKLFGKTPPNTFEGIRDMVANEVVKGTIGNSGALADRTEASEKVKASSSPEQLRELMNGWTELMGGQVKGLERQYQAATKNKDFRERYLTQRTRDAIALSEEKAKATTAPPAAGPYADPAKEQRYQDFLKSRKQGG